MFYYLATPYSKYKDGLEAAFDLACRQSALLIKEGIPVYSPIVHMHSIAKAGKIDPHSHEIWIPLDRHFMRCAKGLIVVKAEGWRESRGIQMEMDHFSQIGGLIVLMEPDIIPSAIIEYENLGF